MIYVAVIVLAHRKTAWGFGAGFAIGTLWNSFSLFVTHLIQTGAINLWTWVRGGHIEHDQLVPMMVTLGGIGHFILMAACLFAVLRNSAESRRWWNFAGGGAVAVAYFMPIFMPIVAFAQLHWRLRAS